MPVLILTAADSIEERVKGLDLGADDYMAKPFEPRELVARLKAVLRRAGPTDSEAPIEIGGLLLERGADADRLNDRGQTALVCAVFRNHEPIARMLLEAGADASLGHQTPEAVAAFFGLPGMTRLLAEHQPRARNRAI